MKIVFFGTPEYVVPILNALHKNFRSRSEGSPVKLVVTQPPRPTGRKQRIEYSEVDHWAHKKKVPKAYNPLEVVEKNIDAEIGILASYGAIIPKKVIDHFPLGILNIHPSLLPKLRGASPVQATIATGNEAGATIIKLDEKLDHGPIVAQFKADLKDSDTTETFRERIFAQSAEVLVSLLPAYIKGKVNIKAQDHKKATFTTMLKKEHGHIPWKYLQAAMQGKSLKDKWEIPFIKNYTTHYTPSTIHRFIRALTPWPGAWSTIMIGKEDKRLKILKSHLETFMDHASQIADDRLVIDTVQIEGKNPVSWDQFTNAYPDLIK